MNISEKTGSAIISTPQNQTAKLKSMGLLYSFSVYTGAALLLLVQTRYLIPFLAEKTGQERILFWFIVGGLGVFVPLIVSGCFMIATEGNRFSTDTFTNRLWFRKLSFRDIVWSIGALILIGFLSWAMMKLLVLVFGQFDHSPPFMAFKPLDDNRYWLLAVWFPYWILNILGEEFLWRGVMLPRQKVAFGKHAWIVHAIGWGIFHYAFGWQLVLTLIPILFILPYAVQKTENSWVGVIIHGGLNGPSFIAIALGLL